VTPMISNVPGTDFVPTLHAAAGERAARSAAS
jgi:hypothetical protein